MGVFLIGGPDDDKGIAGSSVLKAELGVTWGVSTTSVPA